METDLASPPPLIVILGPTASGKTQLALQLAERLNGEIINADSMQLYRGMDIGTAKVSADERRRVPHHLIDVLDPTEEASVAVYREQARDVIDDIRRRGKTPLLAGGSGLYIRSVIDDIEFPPTDADVREQLQRRLVDEGALALRKELHAVDPESAASIHDDRRLVRALEVTTLTGRPFISYMPQRIYHRHMNPVLQIGLSPSAPILKERISQRVTVMEKQGFAEEVSQLHRNYPQGLSRTASQGIGYRQYTQVFNRELTSEAAAQETIAATQKFAKRQLTWFRADPRIHWLQHDDPSHTTSLEHQALEFIHQKGR